MITCYLQPDKLKSWRVLEAFAVGCKGNLSCTTARVLAPGGAAFYGVRPGWLHLWNQAMGERRETFYLDNAWFDVARETYFRIGHNAIQSWWEQPSDGKRLASLGVQVKPWKKQGRKIIVCQQSEEFMCSMANWPNWSREVISKIKKFTDREIVIRSKNMPRPLALDLQDAWLLVTHSSAAAIEALIAGVPVIVTDRDSAAAEFSTGFNTIETPRFADGREAWAARLADSQWTLDEMKNGTAWRQING